MLGFLLNKKRERIARLEDPRSGQAWFQSLDPRQREELTRQWRSEQERWVELRLRRGAHLLGDAVAAGILFYLLDGVSLGADHASRAALGLVGAGTGVVWNLMGATGLSAPLVAMGTFSAGLLITHGGFSGQHAFVLFVVAAISSWLGMRIENRGFE